jgi:hypothetical protein
MPYVIKDLLIDISAAEAFKLPYCRCTLVNTLFCMCTYQITTCPDNSVVMCPHGSVYPCMVSGQCATSDLPRITDFIKDTPMHTPQAGPVIRDMKKYLRLGLDEAEKQEKLMAQGMKPQTKADAIALESKLQEVLKEVSAMKETLK